MRSARTLSDLRSAPLLYQTLPEDLQIARLLDGAIPVLAYREERRYLVFRPEVRWITREEHRNTRVPIEIEGGTQGVGTRLMYMLFDRSTSLVHGCSPRGINAITEMAVALAMIRCDLGRPQARYYWRSFADQVWPPAADPPVEAAGTAEKDELARLLLRTDFTGEATRVVDALNAAADDIEAMAQRDAAPIRPRIGLLTDGRATIYGGIGARLRRLGIELDTVLIGREAARNPDLITISSTVCVVDPALYRASGAGSRRPGNGEDYGRHLASALG
jgi:hypothetical protein